MKILSTQLGTLMTNCYLIIDEATMEAAVIDPAEDSERLHELIDGEGVRLRYILLTHCHRDHASGVPGLHGHYPDAEVYIHALDAKGYGRYDFVLDGVIDGLKTYDEGDELPLGTLTVRVLHTPGHTHGGVTLRVGDALFVGDTLFAGSCGRMDLPGGDREEMAQSLRRFAAMKEEYNVYPGHMCATVLSREQEYNQLMIAAEAEP